LLNTMHLNIS